MIPGIHTRLYSRAFIVEDVDTDSRVVFVSVDVGSVISVVVSGHIFQGPLRTYVLWVFRSHIIPGITIGNMIIYISGIFIVIKAIILAQ